MFENTRQLKEAARAVLENNWTGEFTKPAPSLYPHQWNWDAGFIAIAYAHFDLEKAMKELRSLFQGQWSNGMLPQIVFRPEKETDRQYFPGADFWQSNRSTHAPVGIQTSGITMPPVHGFALWNIYERAADKEKAEAFLKEMFPKVMALHHYFYENRDPLDEGLIYINHPWESGTENSPIWDGPLSKIDPSRLKIPTYERNGFQNKEGTSNQSTNLDYDRYVHLVDLYRTKNYDDKAIYESSPFLIQDPLFNTILVRSNECMIEIAQLIGEDVSDLVGWNDLTIWSMNEKLWNEEIGGYDAWDLRANEKLAVPTSSALLPMFGNIPDQDQAEMMLQLLLGDGFHGPDDNSLYLCPSCNQLSNAFNPENYWCGPVWINMNWMLYQGLLNYEFNDIAENLKDDTIELLSDNGFYEYYDPRKGATTVAGYGTHSFSWSAALCYDLLCHRF